MEYFFIGIKISGAKVGEIDILHQSNILIVFVYTKKNSLFNNQPACMTAFV